MSETQSKTVRLEATAAVATGRTVDRSSPAAELLVRAAGHTPETTPALFNIGTRYRALFDRFWAQTGALWAPKGPVPAQYGLKGVTEAQLASMADNRVFSLDTLERASKADEAGHGIQGVFIPGKTRADLVQGMRQHPVEGQNEGDEAVLDCELGNDELWGQEKVRFKREAVLMAMAPEVPDSPNHNRHPQYPNWVRAVRWNDYAKTLGMESTCGARPYVAAQMQTLVQDCDPLDVYRATLLNAPLANPGQVLVGGYWNDGQVCFSEYDPGEADDYDILRGRVSARSNKLLSF